jgi:hypothetical protein
MFGFIRETINNFKNSVREKNRFDSLIGHKAAQLYQIRLQQIRQEFSSEENFPSRILYPDSKARPLAIGVKYIFDRIALENNINPPSHHFVATPKISTQDRPNLVGLNEALSPVLYAKEYYFKHKKNWEKKFVEDLGVEFYEELLRIRSQLSGRLAEINIKDGSNILILDDFSSAFHTPREIGLAIKSLDLSGVAVHFQSIFTAENCHNPSTFLSGAYYYGLKSINPGFGLNSIFSYTRGNYEAGGLDENLDEIYKPNLEQKAIGVEKKGGKYASIIPNLLPTDRSNINYLRIRLKEIAVNSYDNPFSSDEIIELISKF